MTDFNWADFDNYLSGICQSFYDFISLHLVNFQFFKI